MALIFGAIINSTYGRSNPVVSRERDRVYRGYFEIGPDGEWKGHLGAWDVQPSGDLNSTPAWDAGDLMKNNGRGSVYTWTASGLKPPRVLFDPGDSSLYPLVYPNPRNEDINGDNSKDDNDAKTIINFTLDPNHGGGIYKGKRAIDWKLGDIYHSTPVVVGGPAFYFSENNYSAFYNNNKNRERMVYVGANDGMLHAFKAKATSGDGGEVFSIIPRNLLGNLKSLRSTHDFYVDSSPKAYDVYFSSDSKWKTVLVSGERGGGPYYFALDITVPNDPQILWEWTDTDMGDTWARPDIGKVKVNGVTKTAAFITGGYSTSNSTGNCFYAVDIETGTTLKGWTGLGSTDNKIPSGATAFDADGDGFVDYVYFGDTKGSVWKVDVRSDVTDNWTKSQFFTPADPKPIFYPPAVAKNDAGKILVFFGTGNELDLTPTESSSYFWEVEDKGNTATSNWYKSLSGQKILSSPVIANYVVYFTTWVYDAGASCGAGHGRLWGLTITTKSGLPAGEAGLVLWDPGNKKFKDPVEYVDFGRGVPTAPVVTNGRIYLSSSINANKITEFKIPSWGGVKIRSWREVF